MDQFHCRQDDRTLVRTGMLKWQRNGRGPQQLQPFHHYGIFVNRMGRRFIDEYGLFTRSNSVACSILKQPGMTAAYIWDARIAALMGGKLERYVPPGIVLKAQSLEELAQAAGIDTGGLLETVREFNQAVQEGRTASMAHGLILSSLFSARWHKPSSLGKS